MTGPLLTEKALKSNPQKLNNCKTLFNGGYLWGGPFCMGNLGESMHSPKMWPATPVGFLRRWGKEAMNKTREQWNSFHLTWKTNTRGHFAPSQNLLNNRTGGPRRRQQCIRINTVLIKPEAAVDLSEALWKRVLNWLDFWVLSSLRFSNCNLNILYFSFFIVDSIVHVPPFTPYTFMNFHLGQGGDVGRKNNIWM